MSAGNTGRGKIVLLFLPMIPSQAQAELYFIYSYTLSLEKNSIIFAYQVSTGSTGRGKLLLIFAYDTITGTGRFALIDIHTLRLE